LEGGRPEFELDAFGGFADLTLERRQSAEQRVDARGGRVRARRIAGTRDQGFEAYFARRNDPASGAWPLAGRRVETRWEALAAA
jgi:hypothetical protein